MEKFCQPNLPANNVTTVIMSGEYMYLAEELNKLNINTITTSPSVNLPFFERYHTDMQCSYYAQGKIVIDEEAQHLVKKITKHGVSVELSSSIIKPEYPLNIALNHLIVNDIFIGKVNNTDKYILKFCEENNYKIINVNQGYTKCSTAIVNRNALITADQSIYNACLKQHIDVLKIDAGDICLYGYNYGFIGGCCCKLSKDIMAFTGKVSKHKNYNEIKSFLLNYGVNLLELSNKPLIDIGGIIPIQEKCC